MIANNIKRYRQQKGKSQTQMAGEIGICRSTLAGYESGSNEPNIEKLQCIASYFNITVDELINFAPKKNLESFKILAITVDNENKENIELVPLKARGGYLIGYSDPEYIKQLPKFNLPNLIEGTYRAFEIIGDSMTPISDGFIVLGKYIFSLAELKDNNRYILVTKNEGIVFKRVINNDFETLILYSDNSMYAPYSIKKEEVLELWSCHAFIGFPQNETFTNIGDIVTRLNTIDNKLNKLLG
jgi:transcriptional regulator with XRE-family HTH domain